MNIQEFGSLLFEIEVNTHIMHLQTTSYAEHKALNDVYEGIVGHRDSFLESYQGKYGIVKGYKSIMLYEGKDCAEYLTACVTKVDAYRLTLTEGYLQQICDDISELLRSTLYKIKFLK
jgi:hypothetical protein